MIHTVQEAMQLAHQRINLLSTELSQISIMKNVTLCQRKGKRADG